MRWNWTTHKEAWQQLCSEIGAEFVAGNAWKGHKVEARVGPWTITLDTHTVSTGESHVTYTRIRAPYVNPDAFRFTIYRRGLFSNVGKFLGMQDIDVGDPEFDEAFIIKGADEPRVQSLFADPKLRRLLQTQPQLHLAVKDSEGWFGPTFPENVDELSFQVGGVIQDKEQLKGLFELFSALLERLCRLGSGRREEPGVVL